MYYVFIISFNNKLISVIIDNDFGREYTFVCFPLVREVTIIMVFNFVIINLPLLLISYLHNYVTVSIRLCLKSKDSKFYDLNRNASELGNFLELYSFIQTFISPHNRLVFCTISPTFKQFLKSVKMELFMLLTEPQLNHSLDFTVRRVVMSLTLR